MAFANWLQVARANHLSPELFRDRLRSGWDPECAATTPRYRKCGEAQPIEHRHISQAELLDLVLAEPNLTYSGWCHNCQPDVDPVASRASLLRSLPEVQAAADWLATQRTLPVGPRSVSSYLSKHLAERWAGRYISNGSMIAAALLLGVEVGYNPRHANPALGLVPDPLSWSAA